MQPGGGGAGPAPPQPGQYAKGMKGARPNGRHACFGTTARTRSGPPRSCDLRLDRTLVPGRVHLRPRRNRDRVRRRPPPRAEPGADDALLRGWLLVAHPLHDADGSHRHLRLRGRVLTARLSPRTKAGHDPEGPADRGRVDRAIRDGLVANSAIHARSEEHTSELQSPCNLVCRLLLEKKKTSH